MTLLPSTIRLAGGTPSMPEGKKQLKTDLEFLDAYDGGRVVLCHTHNLALENVLGDGLAGTGTGWPEHGSGLGRVLSDDRTRGCHTISRAANP